MDNSPAKFLFGFLIFSVILWMLFIFAARLFAWFLSRVTGAYVGFRVGGWRCLRDVMVKFEKGAVESVSIGEIRLSLRQSLVRLGVNFFSRDPKLQVLICDVEIIMRSSLKSEKKARSQKSRNSGRGKWMIVVNVARFLSVSVVDLVMIVKTPKITIEVRELKADSAKDGSSRSTLFLQLNLAPIMVHIGEPRASCDYPSCLNGVSTEAQVPFVTMDRISVPFCCETLFVSCEFGHYREDGVVFKNLDVACGEITVNLNEEIFRKNKSTDIFSYTKTVRESNTDSDKTERRPKNQISSSVTKYITMFPEKVGFVLPKFDMNFIHREHALYVENKIMGIQLKIMKSSSIEDMGESTRLDVQMEFSEINILREAGASIFEILKVDVVSSAYIPKQASCVGNTLNTPIRAEIDIKLGGTRCNIIISRLNPWIQLHYAKNKQLVLPVKSSVVKKPFLSNFKFIMWTCTVSAPEMVIVLYSISSSPLYHGCSQSAHLFANNISSSGTAVHVELGEINIHMADEYEECLKECLFGVETNLNSLVHVARSSLDCKDLGPSEDHGPKSELVLILDVTGMGIYFNIKRLESIIATAISLQTFLKKISSGKITQSTRGTHSSKISRNGVPILKFNLERCTVNFSGDTALENTLIADPKHVNYGSQGGQVLVETLADGTLRSADIMSTVSDELKKLKYSLSLEVFHLSLCTNKGEKSTKMEIEKTRSIYQEYLQKQTPVSKVVLLDIQNAKFVQRSGCLKKAIACSYFSATNITLRWEPDAHLSLFELILHLKLLVQKFQEIDKEQMVEASCMGVIENRSVVAAECGQYDKKHKKMESVFAIDVEILTISAGVGDGVDVTGHVQSIFSEDARIGVLLEGLMLTFNDSRVFKSSRMQVSRIPSSNSSLTSAVWDWIIQGIDVHICMPFRLQLRAIEDSVEDMLRCLKLITTAKAELIYLAKKENLKPKQPSPSKLGSIKLSIRKLTADIEEEPIQGWLDEHYYLMKNEACEIAVRLKYLDDLKSKGEFCSESSEIIDSNNERKFFCNGIEVDLHDSFAVCQLQEEMYKQSFRSYFEACQKLVPAEGSGACTQGFQAGFRSSATRTSLLSISATELEVNLTKIDGGNSGMIEVLKKLDPVCEEYNIPFSRLLGINILLHAGFLVVHLRDYTFPLFSATSGKCDGSVVLAQQATCFQPQIHQDVYIGRWRKVRLLRSASGTTPPMKTYLNLPVHFQKAEISFGVGYEPAFADVSYAFTVALRRANLSVWTDCTVINNSDASNSAYLGNSSIFVEQPPKKERSLPWWDDVRYYVHGSITLFFSEIKWNVLATTDPYEKLDKLEVLCNSMEIKQSDGQVCLTAKDFKILLSSLESLVKNCSLKLPGSVSCPFLEAPAFSIEIKMDWECESGNPLNHYLHALPYEGGAYEKVYDPFRSTSLSLRWTLLLRPSFHPCQNLFSSSTVDNSSTTLDEAACKSESVMINSPTMHVGAHDLAWIFKFWNLNYIPPHKLRSFSRWPRFGISRGVRSGNLSLDKVMTEFMLRIDASSTYINHLPLHDDDPAKGLIFKIMRLKYELCYSRGKQKYTFECRREPLDLVYQGLNLSLPNAYLNRGNCTSVSKVVKMTRNGSRSGQVDEFVNECFSSMGNCSEKISDDGFLLSSDYFTIRRQAPKADPARLLAWQEVGRRNLEMTYVRSDFENGSESDEHARSDPSDDGYNVVLSGLKLLWTIENRDAVWSWVGGISKAFEPPKPSPSRQYAHRKTLEKTQVSYETEIFEDDISKIPSGCHNEKSPLLSEQSFSSPSHLIKMDNSSSVAIGFQSEKNGQIIDSEGGTRHFEVNVVEPQFNLHSEEANGRFLLAAVSGRVLARSFHSVLHVGYEMIEKLGTGNLHIPEYEPEMTSKRMEFSVMLERVQAHVAPTDVDPGAGLQWLPKIRRSSPKLKRTGALLERVFMPCDMYFRYTRYKGGTADLKVKPLKELTFNSHDITATMTSRQFQVMQDVLSNLLFARLPKPRKSSLSYPAEDDDGDVEEEADEMVPYGVEEVELARVNLEQKERELKLLLDDIRRLSFVSNNASSYSYLEIEGDLWMMAGGRLTLVQKLKKEFINVKKCKKLASASLRMALQKAAQLRLMEKDKNKSPSYAMRISLQINKVVWGMLVDGNHFAEAEINDMIYDFERDYRDVGVARFTTKYFVVRNCLPNAKSDMLLSVWNAPSDWGKKVMLKVDAKQRALKDGSSPLELFQVEIYPLKIYLTETMYKMMWEYFFPEKDQDSHRRQETWKVSTTAGLKRMKKSTVHDASLSSSYLSKESEVSYKSSGSIVPTTTTTTGMNQSLGIAESCQASKLQNLKTNFVCGSVPELRRTSSFDKTWEENVAESVADELVLQVQSSGNSSSRTGPTPSIQQSEERLKNKLKESKPTKTARTSNDEKKVGRSSDEKRPRPRKMMEFHNIKISQVELLVTYEGSRFSVSDMRLLMDTFHLVEFTGTWRRLFSGVKKHIIWGVLKSVTGMQGKKFKDKAGCQSIPDSDLRFSDSDGGGDGGASDQYPVSWLRKSSDGAGDGFVTSIRGLFNSQRRKARAFVLRTMRGEAENEYQGDWSESDAEFSPFAKQLTINKAKRLIRRHTKKYRSKGHKGSSQRKEALPSSSIETTAFEMNSSEGSSSPPYEDFND